MQCSIGGTDARTDQILTAKGGASYGDPGLTISTCPYKEVRHSNTASTSRTVRVTVQVRKELHELPSLTPLTVLSIRGVL